MNESWRTPLTEEIRLEILGTPDLPNFRVDLLIDGDSVYSRDNPFEIWGLPRKHVGYVWGLGENLLVIFVVVII